jgi:ribulose-phosphate 3-epimerase
MKISVSFIKSKYKEIETIKKIDETNADYLHVDLMDGKFTEKKNYDLKMIYNFAKYTKKPLDIHLMVNDPKKYISDLALLNTMYITFHLEAVSKPMDLINLIHSYGLKCGISIKPETPITALKPYLDIIDQVLVMSVNPGAGGQSFMMESINKINELKKFNKNFIISVDGGINDETINYVKMADMVVSGSFVCMSDNYQKQINILRG